MSVKPRRALLEVSEVRRAAQGYGWDKILSQLSPKANEAINAYRDSSGRRKVECPNHRSKSKSEGRNFTVLKDFVETGGSACNTCGVKSSGFDTLMFLERWDFPTAMLEVGILLGLVTEHGATKRPSWRYQQPLQQAPDPVQEARKAAEAIELRSKMRRYWSESLPLTHPDALPARLYLFNRGLRARSLSQQLRYHPRMWLQHEGEKYGFHGAILGRFISPDMSRSVNINRIFVTHDGRKVLPEEGNKKPMAMPNDDTLTGSCVWLDKPGPIVAVGEGVETMIAVRGAYPALPVGATTTATLLAGLILPAQVQLVLVFADKDVSQTGQTAAASLITRVKSQGLTAKGYLPGLAIPDGAKSLDWRDVWEMHGPHGFPQLDWCRVARLAA